MLQINPSEIIRLKKLFDNSLDVINDNILFLQNEYINQNSEKLTQVEEIKKLVDILYEKTNFINKIINELENITGEEVNKLINKKYSMSFYEEKIANYYAKAICNNFNTNELDILALCYSKDDQLDNYCNRENFTKYFHGFLNNFDFNKYGLSKEEVEKELLYIFNKRGATEAHAVMRALVNNIPDNYLEYNFNPTKQIKSNKYYDYNSDIIDRYQTNSEIININGYDYEICQVLPKDCTNIEKVVYNYAKANTINTIRALPNNFIKTCAGGNSNAIILTCDKLAMNNEGNWSGYYKSSTFFGNDNNMIVLDAHGSLNNNEYYTQDTIIHEMGHKYDEMIYNKSIIDRLFGRKNYTSNSDEWNNAFKKYKNVVNSINTNGYETFPNVNEFYGDVMVAYFKSPDAMKTLCPEVYDLTNKMLEGEEGYTYQQKMVTILSRTI